MSFRSAISSGRRLMNRTMVDRAWIITRSTQADGRGGTLERWSTHGEDEDLLPCRFGSLDDKDARPIAGQTYGAAAGVVHFPRGLEIVERIVAPTVEQLSSTSGPPQELDRVVQRDGRTWTIVARTDPPGEFGLSIRFLVREAGR